MRGCLSFIISTIISGILGIALIIFLLFGGVNYVKGLIDAKLNPPPTEIQTQAQKIANFSKLPKEYKLTRSVDMLGVNAVIGKHITTDQKVALINPGWAVNITKNDIRSNTVENQLKDIASKFNNQAIKLNTLEITKKGTFKAFDQHVPYVKVKLTLIGNSDKNLEGIIGVATGLDGKNNLVVSMNQPGKYNQNVAEKFFKNIKFNTAKQVKIEN